MTGFHELSARIDEAEQAMRTAEAQLQSFQSVAPALAELVGTGEAADGRVVVAWTAQGMSGLELDPMVMRMPSVELAAAVKLAVGAAMADLRTRTREVLAEAGVAEGSRPTPDQVRERLAELRRMTTDGARRAAADFDRARQLRDGADRRP